MVAAERQLAVELNRSGGRKHRRRFTAAFRLLWVALSRLLENWGDMVHLIRRLSRENPLWGPDRIRDTLLLLGYEAPCAETICKYMVKPSKPRSLSTT